MVSDFISYEFFNVRFIQVKIPTIRLWDFVIDFWVFSMCLLELFELNKWDFEIEVFLAILVVNLYFLYFAAFWSHSSSFKKNTSFNKWLIPNKNHYQSHSKMSFIKSYKNENPDRYHFVTYLQTVSILIDWLKKEAPRCDSKRENFLTTRFLEINLVLNRLAFSPSCFISIL